MPTILTAQDIANIVRATWLAVFGPLALKLGDVSIEYEGQPDETIGWAGWEMLRGQEPGQEHRWFLYRGVTTYGGHMDPPDYDVVEVGSYSNPIDALRAAVEAEVQETLDNVIVGYFEAIDLAEEEQ